MISVLEDWDGRCVDVLKEIEGQVREVRRVAVEKRRREDAHAKAVEGKLAEGEKKGKRAGDTGEGDEMDIDGEGRKTRGSKRPGGNILRGLGERFGGGN